VTPFIRAKLLIPVGKSYHDAEHLDKPRVKPDEQLKFE
jgi:hypothetical protein